MVTEESALFQKVLIGLSLWVLGTSAFRCGYVSLGGDNGSIQGESRRSDEQLMIGDVEKVRYEVKAQTFLGIIVFVLALLLLCTLSVCASERRVACGIS
ncbi:MAG TPA: hypothetical protein VEF04_03070 [Blastocatellia bacterium]|nr:hypothetical protein [Blastocatellia bacterium]